MTTAGHSIEPQYELSRLVTDAARRVWGDSVEVEAQVRRSDRSDYQADLAMRLAGKVGASPREVAERLVASLPESTLVERVEVAGTGFINFTLSASWLGAAAAAMLADPRLGVGMSPAPERIVVDYSHPNVAKEMHVGHLRGTIIGDALARVLEWRGHTVIRQNHLGDWGTPFGMLIEHLLDVGEAEAARELSVGELALFYKAARRKFDDDESFRDRSRRRVVLLQSGDADTLTWWRLLVDLSEQYFSDVYQRLGVTLQRADSKGESFYNNRLVPLADELLTSGAATLSDGALCLFPPGFRNKAGQPLPLIVRKSDGGFGYPATDLAAIRYRLNELEATRILYVVGAPQSQHFALVFAAARELGWLKPPIRAEHVAFGSVLGTDKKMFKTRAGDTVRLVDLLGEAVDRADVVVGAKAADLDHATRAQVSRMVGIGAIKYADLSCDRIKDYVFDIDRMVAFEGNTAGYLQYAHARIRSIFRKVSGDTQPSHLCIAEREERKLVLLLLSFSRVVEDVETTLEPHRLAGYLHSLATTFTSFYEACPILKAPEPVRSSRLALAELTRRTLAQGTELLGIEVPDRM